MIHMFKIRDLEIRTKICLLAILIYNITFIASIFFCPDFGIKYKSTTILRFYLSFTFDCYHFCYYIHK